VEELSTEALIDRLINVVKDFSRDAPQGDDMTVVVLKVEA
jgi:serine phosphatase RsbU (regulator of sigma subunit)